MSASPAMSNRSEMMFLGRECHHPACHLHDFLPFSCPACQQSFCQPHFLPSQHACTAPLPASMVDRIAPVCPMCSEIVPYPRSSVLDPNQAVEKHILSGTCAGFEGGEDRKKAELRRKRENGEICWKKSCSKVLVVKMKCESCQHMFCPTHRHSTSHICQASGAPSSSSSSTGTPQPPVTKPAGKAALGRFLPPSMQSPSTSSSTPVRPTPQPPIIPNASQPPVRAHSMSTSDTISAGGARPMDARAAAAAAALKRAGQDVKVPFVKTKVEKRSQAELNSTIQAMKARHDKGLLSKAEELKYAELVGEKEASRRGGTAGKTKGKEGKGDCVIA
ncbi:hypothetical protein IAU60_002329 [Kwoniella sp. DSM 27419]